MKWFKKLINKVRDFKTIQPVIITDNTPVSIRKVVKITEDSTGITLTHNLTDDDALALINRVRMDLMLKLNN